MTLSNSFSVKGRTNTTYGGSRASSSQTVGFLLRTQDVPERRKAP